MISIISSSTGLINKYIHNILPVSGPSGTFVWSRRITLKSDAGTIVYDVPGKPYAPGSIDPSEGLVPEDDQVITYTSFGKVKTISENSYSSSFIYDPGEERARMTVSLNDSTILTRWYPSGSYIKETAGSVTKEYTFIGGDAYSAPVVCIAEDNTVNWYYLLRDHLGSITHVVSAESNSVVAEYSYDAWGRMRNPLTWEPYSPGSEPELFVAGRGFTGHEHLPWFNSINMNGRVYDPLSGVFLSPDIYVQDPSSTQNFNRYSYCGNNPLSYTDLTGYQIDPQFQRLINTAVPRWLARFLARLGSPHKNNSSSTSYDFPGYPDIEGSEIGDGKDFIHLSGGLESADPILGSRGSMGYSDDVLFHKYYVAAGQGVDPYQYSGKEPPASWKQFFRKYKGESYFKIITESGWTDGMPAGPKMRYVVNPYDGKVMDMRHVMVIGFGGTILMTGNSIKGNIIGLGVEFAQWMGPLIPFVDMSHTRGSAFNRQDFYSNNLGAIFGTYYLFTGQFTQDWTSTFNQFLNAIK